MGIIGCLKKDVAENKIVYFCKKFNATEQSVMKINITADSKYRLYINGKFMGIGPAKGNDSELFYDELTLTGCFSDGENQIEVRVLSLAPSMVPEKHRYITSLRRTGVCALSLCGTLDGAKFEADESWDCAVETGIDFLIPEYAYYTGLPEYVKGEKYQKSEYEKAIRLCCEDDLVNYGEPNQWYSVKSPIPVPRLDKVTLDLKENGVFDFGYLTTAYLCIKFAGCGKVKLTYAERYVNGKTDDRQDASGEILGDYDIVEVDGELFFEPYWFRCFRFIKVETEGDVRIEDAYGHETGYPLETSDDYDFGNEVDNKLFEISKRTLLRCMHDTFNDCPYYEQLQYAMDTHLQCIYTYQLSGDDRLQRRAIRDFALSANGEGLTQCRTPSMQKQFIPAFSLYYVLMVLEHYERFSDKQLLLENMPKIIGVLNWYKNHSDEDFLVKKSIYWHFLDWATEYKDNNGVPVDESGKLASAESLMLCCVLRKVSKAICGTVYEKFAEEYTVWADSINKTADELLFDEKVGMYANTKSKKAFCQHSQIWAVLSGCAKDNAARKIMENSFSEGVAQSTFAYAYFLFRAIEGAGLYDLRSSMLNKLRGLLELNLTTIPETPENARSECHAWGAVMLYELTAMDLGVKAENGVVVINPYVKDRDFAKGTVHTGLGPVYVSWKKENDEILIEYKVPENVQVEIAKETGSYTVKAVCSSNI